MRMVRLFGLAAATAFGGYGCLSISGDDDTIGNDTACTVKLTGAIVATTPCTAGATYGRNIVGVSDLAITNTGNPGFGLGISKTGQLANGTIRESSSDVTKALTTASNGSITSGGLLWSQSTEEPAHGSVTVNLTSVTLGSDGYTFTVHGTADGTLTASPATPGATGTVTIHVAF
jgi:hypothetical protein